MQRIKNRDTKMDIQEKISLERKTERSSEVDLPNILKYIKEGILIVGGDLRVITANDTALEIFSQADAEIDGKRLADLVRNPKIHKAFKRAIKKDRSSELKVELVRSKNRIFEIKVDPVQTKDEKQAIGIFYEITQVEHLEKVRQEFLSNISHELRTPLTSILAFVETLENGGIKDKKNNLRFLKIIRKNSVRMRHLIDDISELSSIEAGKVQIDPKPIALSDLVDGIYASLSAKTTERKIKLKNKVRKETEVMADEIRLEQMLINLIDNAIKFNSEKGTVEVRYSADESFNYIDVTDTGEGILKEQMPRIFERLYRGDRARSREVGGTGLGLAIVKHLALLHGGEVSVTSEMGVGSTFTVQIPKDIME